MRQALFVVVMVAAAFLGGAMVNGPAVRWTQARLLDYLGLKEGEIASVDLPGSSPETTNGQEPKPSPTTAAPTAHAPSVTTEKPSKKADTSHPSSGTSVSSKSSLNRGRSRSGLKDKPQSEQDRESSGMRNRNQGVEGMPASLPPLTAIPEPEAPRPSESGVKPGLASPRETPGLPELDAPLQPGRHGTATAAEQTAPEHAAQAPGLPAPLDPTVGPAILASLSPAPSTGPLADSPARADAVALETVPPTAPLPSPAATLPAGPTSSVGDWAILRRKMQSLGVTHYTIDGQLGGRVIFSCLIPLAGRQAVSQRFEAEGDDDFQAAQAAMRRIASGGLLESRLPLLDKRPDRSGQAAADVRSGHSDVEIGKEVSTASRSPYNDQRGMTRT